MGWLGLDDTDSLAGGCTTEVFHRLLSDLPTGVLTSIPNLVRLWPFAQQRTRGNAALSVELKDYDEASLLQHLDDWWNKHISPLEGQLAPSMISSRKQVASSPGMVWFSEKPDSNFYWNAVRGHVELSDIPEPTKSWGGHGKIGASAAVAWPQTSGTWEGIAWRLPGAKKERSIDSEVLEHIDGWESIVLSRDPRRGKLLIAPRGSSPVLFGIRSLDRTSAEEALALLSDASGTEATSGSCVFRTNQASGDHLPGSIELMVSGMDVHKERKHVRLSTDGPDMLVFSEGGPVNSLARWLQPGDCISVQGLLHPDGTLHAERMKLVSAVPRSRSRPRCPTCQVRLKSMGLNQGLRCPSCKRKSDDHWELDEVSPPFEGWVEPPLDARRHLSTPLQWSKNHLDFSIQEQNHEKESPGK